MRAPDSAHSIERIAHPLLSTFSLTVISVDTLSHCASLRRPCSATATRMFSSALCTMRRVSRTRRCISVIRRKSSTMLCGHSRNAAPRSSLLRRPLRRPYVFRSVSLTWSEAGANRSLAEHLVFSGELALPTPFVPWFGHRLEDTQVQGDVREGRKDPP